MEASGGDEDGNGSSNRKAIMAKGGGSEFSAEVLTSQLAA